MITKPTVFVLGAGVSTPFGFPSGRTLLNILCGNTGGNTFGQELLNFHNRLNDFLGKHFMPGYMTDLVRDLKSSSPPSIDTWLAFNQSHKDVAKIALATLVYECEAQCLNHQHRDDNWFEWIFMHMMKGVTSLDDFLANKITFVTFNYDRLLEWKLLNAMVGFFREKFASQIPRAAQEILQKIVHVHGSLSFKDADGYRIPDLFGAVSFLGARDWNGKWDDRSAEVVPYVRYAAEGIKIIGEKGEDDQDILKATRVLIKAEKVIFLGFGYDERNLRLLSVDEWSAKVPDGNNLPQHRRPIIGSAYKMGTGQKEDVMLEFGGNIFLGDAALSCVPFCNEYVSIR